jgi:membrane AbrB-like protein
MTTAVLSFLRPFRLKRLRPVSGWTLLMALSYVSANFARILGVPAAHLLVPLVLGVGVALSGLVRRQFPKQANRAAQAVVGVLMGSYLDPASARAVADSIVPLAVVTLATIMLCVVVAIALPRLTLIARSDAVLGMVPGGSAAIIACADDLDADSRVVAFMQYLRVGLVAATAPLVVLAFDKTTEADQASPALLPESVDVVSSDNDVAGLLVLTALCVLGVSAGRRVGLPAPALLGPMVLTAVAAFTGAANGFTPVGLLRDVVFIAVGLEVGLRFTPASLRHVGRLLPWVLASTAIVCITCAGLAGLLSLVMGIPFIDAYLATTPGGINAVLATAASLHGQVALISTTQSLRLFIVMLLAPPLIRWTLPARDRVPEPV